MIVNFSVRVLPNGSNTWQEVRLADVYTFRKGRATNMRAFANRDDALRWVGVTDLSKQDSNRLTAVKGNLHLVTNCDVLGHIIVLMTNPFPDSDRSIG